MLTSVTCGRRARRQRLRTLFRSPLGNAFHRSEILSCLTRSDTANPGSRGGSGLRIQLPFQTAGILQFG